MAICLMDYKKNNMSTDREKREGKQKGESDKRITESKGRQNEALHCAQTQQIRLRSSWATPRMQHVEVWPYVFSANS
jgi:hypothetical protein